MWLIGDKYLKQSDDNIGYCDSGMIVLESQLPEYSMQTSRDFPEGCRISAIDSVTGVHVRWRS